MARNFWQFPAPTCHLLAPQTTYESLEANAKNPASRDKKARAEKQKKKKKKKNNKLDLGTGGNWTANGVVENWLDWLG